METSKKSRWSYSQFERMIFPEWLFHPGNEELRRIAVIAYTSVFIAVVSITIFSILRLLQHDYVLGFVDLSFAIVLAGIILYHRKTKKFDDYLTLFVGVTVYGMFCIYLFFFFELGKATFLWSYTFPLTVFPILGSRRGRIAVILFLIPISLLLIVDPPLSFMTSYPRGFAFPFIPSILAVSGMSYLYEKTRERNRQQLELANIALQRSNEEMEQQVQQRTAELARSEQNYRFLTERMSDMIWTTDLNLNVTYVSPSVTRILGFTPEEYRRLPLHERVTPESFDKAMAIFTSKLEREKMPATDPERNLQMELEFCHKDGSTVWMESLMNAIRDDEGNLVGIHGVSRDITERKQAEEAIQQSEKRFRDIADNAAEWVWEVNAEGKYTYSGPVVEQLLGYKPEEILNKHFYDLFHPEDREELRKAAFEVFSNKNPFREFLNRNLHKNGETVWLSTSGVPILDEKGNLMGYRGADTDITDRKRVENALRRSEENFRRSMDDSALGVRILTVEGETIYANRAILDIYGYDGIEELRTTPLKERYTPESYAESEIREEKRKRGGDGSSEYDISIVRKNGEVRHLHVFRKEVLWDGERQFQVLYNDITERKQAEDTLWESEEKYRNILENIEEAYFELDLKGNITFFNEPACRITGYSRSELMGMNYRQYSPPEVVKTLFTSFNTIYKTGEKWSVNDFSLIRKDQSTRSIELSVTLMRDVSGEVNGFRCIARDITERKRAEEALRRSEKNFRRSLNESPMGVRIVTVEGETIYANRAIRDFFGYDSIEELRATPVVKRYTPESYAEFQIRREKRRRGDHCPSEYEISIVRKDGEVRHLHVFRKEVLWDGEKRFQVLYNDITERKVAEEALQKSEEYFRAITEHSTDIIFIADKKGTITYASPSIERSSGYKPEELIGKSGFDFILQADLPRAIYDYGKAILTKMEDVIPNAFRVRHKNGSERILEGVGKNLLDNPAVAGFVINVRDITERKRLTDAIQAEHDKIETVTKNIGVGLAIISKDYRTIWANDVIRNIFGETEGKLCYVKYNYQQTICPWCGVRRVFEAGENNVVTEAEGYDKDGNRIWSQIIATPIRDESGEVTAALEVVVPITERKQAEEAIKASHQQLRAFAGRLQSVREEQRKEIAREIHDELGGALTALRIDLSSLANSAPKSRDKTKRDSFLSRVLEMTKLIDETIGTVRRLVTELRPSILDDFGLLEALEWQLQEFQKRTGIQSEFVSTLEYINMDEELSTAVFRIFQESLTNVARHANATKVTATLYKEADGLVLKVDDNGKGISEDDIHNTKSVGLIGMREHASFLGGKVNFSGEPSKGTTVSVQFPFESQEGTGKIPRKSGRKNK